MDDWDGFVGTCTSEEYSVCDLVIDGEAYNDVGIRGKGNTSLSNVASMDSDRYSFKVEFDQYDNTKSYYGLDKLSLNNIIQDATYMKDYLTYQLMGQFGVAAPLCSYVYITVNGEEWGLYLAVEGAEDAFLQRNYGANHGELYKPDSMSFGGGRGNGRDFDMNDFMEFRQEDSSAAGPDTTADTAVRPQKPDNMQNFDPSAIFGGNGTTEMPTGFAPSSLPEGQQGEPFPSAPTFGAEGSTELPEGFDPTDLRGEKGGRGMPDGMGSEDVKLQYIDDDPSSYTNIFDNAKTDITAADQTRLIEALKALSEGERIEDAVDVEAVIRYFVVHNFVVNGDSYTGSMVHNYYLYEEGGALAMIPWDYNLAFGTFQGSSAESAVNDPIDTPLSVTGSGDRPMADWIFSSEEYTALYHQYFSEFLESVDFAQLIDDTAALISPYVEKDPTKFCTYEEFQSGTASLREFCLLREESVMGQLSGAIPSTSSGQSEDSSSLIDASHINISDMGSMGMGGMNMGGGGFGDRGGRGDRTQMDNNNGQTLPDGAMPQPTGDTKQPPGRPE